MADRGFFGVLVEDSPFYEIFEGKVPLLSSQPIKAQGPGTRETQFYQIDIERLSATDLHRAIVQLLSDGGTKDYDVETYYDAENYFLTMGYIPVRGSQIAATAIDLRMVL